MRNIRDETRGKEGKIINVYNAHIRRETVDKYAKNCLNVNG